MKSPPSRILSTLKSTSKILEYNGTPDSSRTINPCNVIESQPRLINLIIPFQILFQAKLLEKRHLNKLENTLLTRKDRTSRTKWMHQ